MSNVGWENIDAGKKSGEWAKKKNLEISSFICHASASLAKDYLHYSKFGLNNDKPRLEALLPLAREVTRCLKDINPDLQHAVLLLAASEVCKKKIETL